jgi:hypothetical protein
MNSFKDAGSMLTLLLSINFYSCTKPAKTIEIKSEWSAARGERDIENQDIKILSFGLSTPCLDYEKLTRKYGFSYKELGCVPPLGEESLGIDEYNAEINTYLTRLNGKGWENKLNEEIDSAQQHNPCFK